MRLRLLASLCTIAMTLVPVSASEAPVMPAGVQFHLAVKSPSQLLQQLDTAVAQITEGTKNAMPQGFVSMLVMMQLPMPDVIMAADTPWHFMATYNDLCMVVQKRMDDFVDMLDTPMERKGDMCVVTFPHTGKTFIVDGGDFVVLAEREERARNLLASLKEWTPDYNYGGEVFFQGKLPHDWINLIPQTREIFSSRDELAEIRTRDDWQEKLAQLDTFGINSAVIDGLISLVEKYLSEVLYELAKANKVAVVLDFQDNRLTTDWRIGFKDGSFGAELAAKSSARELFNPEILYMPEDATMVAGVVAPDQLIPRYAELMRTLNADLAKKVFPKQSAGILALTEKSLAMQLGPYLTANYFRPGAQYTAMWMRADKPEQMLSLQKEAMGMFNTLFAEAISNSDYQFTIETSDGKTAEGTPYVKTVIDIPEEAMESIVASLDGDESVFLALSQLSEFVQYCGVKNGMVVSVAGMADEDDFVAALAAADAMSQPPILPEKAKAAFAPVRTSRDAIILWNMDEAALAYGREVARMVDTREEYVGFEALLDELEDEFILTETFGSAGYGGVDGMLSFTISLPLDGVNAIWRNGETYYDICQRQLREAEEEDASEEEIYDDDDME